MGYVVYNTISTKIIGSKHRKIYKTHAAAQAHLTRMTKMGYSIFQHGIAEEKFYQEKIAKTVTKRNLMTGQEYQESVNTPLCCSPASETYWSM
jgi:hypothetical protein